MVEFTFTVAEDDEEYPFPNPGEPSTIMFQVEYVDGKDWGIMDYGYEGGAADYENSYGCGIDYVLTDILCVKQDLEAKGVKIEEDMWYVVEGFTCSFSTDYYGETDCYHEYDNVRRATIYDNLYFGV